jgi:hypothetical protein
MEKQTLTMNWPPLNYLAPTRWSYYTISPAALLVVYLFLNTTGVYPPQCIYHQSPTLPSPVYPLQIIFTSKPASPPLAPWLQQEKQNKGARELHYDLLSSHTNWISSPTSAPLLRKIMLNCSVTFYLGWGFTMILGCWTCDGPWGEGQWFCERCSMWTMDGVW